MLSNQPQACSVLANYDALQQLLPALPRWRPEYIAADETHLVKNPKAQRSRALHKLGTVARYRRILSGTPTAEGHEGIFSQYKFLDPTIFGKRWAMFRHRYLIEHPLWRSKVIGYQNLQELREKILSVATRVRREECFDMPQVLEIEREISLPSGAQHAYDRLARTDDTSGVANALTLLLRLQQVTSGFVATAGGIEWLHTRKIEAVLGEISEPLDAGQKVVIFSRFRAEQAKLECYIRKEFFARNLEHVLVLNGDTPASERVRIQDHFGPNGPHLPLVLLAQVETGGLSISLAGANLAIFTSHTFSYADFAQSRDRIWKPGAKLVYTHVVVPSSVDRFIRECLRRKHDVSEAFLNTPLKDAVRGGLAVHSASL